MNDLAIFDNQEFGQVRATEIDGEPWFVGKDVAEALGYSNTADAIQKHVDDEDKQTSRFAIGDQNYNMTIINESGLYALIFGSKLESAKRFKRWVTSEVLPAIRRSGSYSVQRPKANSLRDVLDYANLVRTIMRDQGASAEQTAAEIRKCTADYGVKFPEHFVNPDKLTLKDVYDMVDYVFDHPKIGRRKPTYEDFVMEQTVRIKPEERRLK